MLNLETEPTMPLPTTVDQSVDVKQAHERIDSRFIAKFGNALVGLRRTDDGFWTSDNAAKLSDCIVAASEKPAA